MNPQKLNKFLSEQPSTSTSCSHANHLNFNEALDLRAIEKKITDPSYLERTLIPYYDKNKYPCDSEKQFISNETGIPVQIVKDWYSKQWKNWTKGKEKFMRIQRSEKELLKSFNESISFTDKTFSELVTKTELNYDEIVESHIILNRKMIYFTNKNPDPSNELLQSKSRLWGVKIEVLKDWVETRKKNKSRIPESKRKEKVMTPVKKIKNKTKSSKVTKNITGEEILNGFNIYNQVPSVDLKEAIARMLDICYNAVSELFLTMNKAKGLPQAIKNKAANHYKTAKEELLNGFDIKEKDLECFPAVKGSKHFTVDESDILKEFFYNDPYPQKKMIIWMCVKLKCRYKRVYNWFSKKRSEAKTVFNRMQKSSLASQNTAGVQIGSQVDQGASASSSMN